MALTVGVITGLTLYPYNTQALLMEHDLLLGGGDALLTYDDDTGLEWLDLTYTTGLSYLEINDAWIGSGDPLWGFRHANPSEVETLFVNAGVDPINASSAYGTVSSLLGLVGVTELYEADYPGGSVIYTRTEKAYGLSFYRMEMGDPMMPTYLDFYVPSELFAHSSFGTIGGLPSESLAAGAYIPARVDADHPVPDENFSAEWLGHWLVRDYTDPGTDPTVPPVPEPATMLLFGTGLAGLVAFRKKIKK